MAVKLNLLPSDYVVSDSVASVLRIVHPLNLILLGLFLVSGLGMAAFFIFSSITIKNLNATNNTLKNQIQSQQTAQQQVVLLKDRLTKIKKAFTKPSAVKNLALVDPILARALGTSSIVSLEVDAQKTVVSVNFKTNSSLTDFLANLNSLTTFSSISMNLFRYTPGEGYTVEFAFVGKT